MLTQIDLSLFIWKACDGGVFILLSRLHNIHNQDMWLVEPENLISQKWSTDSILEAIFSLSEKLLTKLSFLTKLCFFIEFVRKLNQHWQICRFNEVIRERSWLWTSWSVNFFDQSENVNIRYVGVGWTFVWVTALGFLIWIFGEMDFSEQKSYVHL